MFKTEWIEAQATAGNYHLVDGVQLAKDTARTLNELERHGYMLVSITPVTGGRWRVDKYDSRVIGTVISGPTNSPDIVASVGYSMTDGLLIVAQKK